jgi:tetratricopeptide (TPR) repeat protein
MHSAIGAGLMAQNKAGEAIPHFEQVIALKPNLPSAYEDLARAYLAVGQLRSAIGAASRGLALHETAQTKTLFAQCVRSTVYGR